MGQRIDYSNLSPAHKYEKALRDVLAWLGEKEPNVRKTMLEHCVTAPQAHLALSFAGIEGYPARIYWGHIRRM